MGLGLFSKRIIQDIHGGQLHVLKSRINEGTIIQIILKIIICFGKFIKN